MFKLIMIYALSMVVVGCSTPNVFNVETVVCGRMPNFGNCEFRCVLDTDFTKFDECDKVRCSLDIWHKKIGKRIAWSGILDAMIESEGLYHTSKGNVFAAKRSLGSCDNVRLDSKEVEVHVVCATLDFKHDRDLCLYLAEVRDKAHMIFDEKSGCVVAAFFLNDFQASDFSVCHPFGSCPYVGLYMYRVCLCGMPVQTGLLKKELIDLQISSHPNWGM